MKICVCMYPCIHIYMHKCLMDVGMYVCIFMCSQKLHEFMHACLHGNM